MTTINPSIPINHFDIESLFASGIMRIPIAIPHNSIIIDRIYLPATIDFLLTGKVK